MSIEIRSAHQADYPQLCRLCAQIDELHAALQPSFFRRAQRPRPQSEFVAWLADPHSRTLVAEKAGSAVGAVQLRIYDTKDQPTMVPSRRAYVQDLVVDAQCRREGVGQALMRAATSWCAQQGATQMVLTVWEGNVAAIEFYEMIGYQQVSRVLAIDVG
jgi:ribosomal protein S18 acetylase RimI-like enzyme